MQLVEAHLIPGSTLRAADLKPGVLYQTALAGAFLTVRSIHCLGGFEKQFMAKYAPGRSSEERSIFLHAVGVPA